MDAIRIGRSIRALRRRLGWRQADLAAKAGLRQQTVSDLERGRVERATWRTLERVLAPLDARLDVAIRWRGAALDQLLDERHARLCGLVARRLRQMGYETRVEVTYSIYGERGSVDVIGWRPADRALVIVEVKVDIGSAEGTVRKHDEKQRLARTIARERFGGEPRVVVGLLVVADGTTSRRRIDRHEEVFGPAYPSRGRSAWALAEHGVAGRGLAFLPVTANAGKRRPATRRPAA